MALLKCKECGSKVRTIEKYCPECGAILKQKPSFFIITILGIIIIAIAIYTIYQYRNPYSDTSYNHSPPKSLSEPKPEKELTLDASVRFTGEQFVIENKDWHDWTNVKLEINSGIFSGGYILRVPVIKAGTIYTVGAMQFAKTDGERFNPFSHKPVNIYIRCETRATKGSYYGSWK
ncbi:MAG: hypothetical protein SCARUB_01869 [Candidatus Scalindua rubra]|uniref:Zinc-ribbon domain-containing protein n=1 Tax=Candidatus Scalindua rubra TaxID=1872076 RepID=A0A1E3XBJ0_9BACT|nr:MAG: hypothetical protein SCARUB_01869 [Candidatus Scalindua rubra]